MHEKHRLLAEFPVVTTIPLLWGDLDAFGHVNNLVYLRWAEAGRVEYLLCVGQFPPLPPSGVAPILASVKCDYRRVVNYPDTVYVGTRIARIGNSSLQMQHRIVSRHLDEIAAEVDSTLVMLDYRTSTPVTVPAEVRETIGKLEAQASGLAAPAQSL
ncbi:MAG TPA: thioesterase family protein [Bryobacteraceae bacterium]|nr:thioesterase family protein [Bryobacteraceae bacterium]